MPLNTKKIHKDNKFTKSQQNINHFIYKDDDKIFA